MPTPAEEIRLLLERLEGDGVQRAELLRAVADAGAELLRQPSPRRAAPPKSHNHSVFAGRTIPNVNSFGTAWTGWTLNELHSEPVSKTESDRLVRGATDYAILIHDSGEYYTPRAIGRVLIHRDAELVFDQLGTKARGRLSPAQTHTRRLTHTGYQALVFSLLNPRATLFDFMVGVWECDPRHVNYLKERWRSEPWGDRHRFWVKTSKYRSVIGNVSALLQQTLGLALRTAEPLRYELTRPINVCVVAASNAKHNVPR